MTPSPAVALARRLALAVLALGACRAPAPPHATSTPAPPAPRPRLELPAPLEPERGAYERDVDEALARVAGFFRAAGVDLPDGRLIESAIVFEGPARAREYIAKEYGAPPESVPGTFAGTVVGERLLLISRESYRAVWGKTYADWPWTEAAYRQLIVHELAHRAHEAVAIARLGSADAMGPPWFFEGLAVVCAGQFETGEAPMGREEIDTLVGAGRTPPVSYPLYGRIVRSLAATFAIKTVVVKASDPGFPGVLWPERAKRPPGGS